MKHVLIVAGALSVGGAERVCRNIGFFADSAQFRIDYVVFGDTVGAYEPELLEKGCRIWHLASPGRGYIRFYRELKSLIRENRYDVVHCHTMFNSGLVLLAARQCGVPVRIAHSHSIRGQGRSSAVQALYEKTMRRWILRDATCCVGCGQAAGEWLFGEKTFQDRGLVILNGIELADFRFDRAARERIRSELGWEDCFVIGHAGHLEPVKNQVFLIRLMPELLKSKPSTRLLLLGDGSDRPMLEQTVQALHLEDRVLLTGNVSNVNEYLSALDVFAFPSLYEGMPLAIVEAQANGVPCVLSDRVPKDVFLTDLLRPQSLEDNTSGWIDALLAAKRNAPEQYLARMEKKGFGIQEMLHKIYSLYQGSTL